MFINDVVLEAKPDLSTGTQQHSGNAGLAAGARDVKRDVELLVAVFGEDAAYDIGGASGPACTPNGLRPVMGDSPAGSQNRIARKGVKRSARAEHGARSLHAQHNLGE